MPDYDVDITNCDEEPIHLIGEIQSYGTLIAADDTGLIIQQVAANTDNVLGLAPKTLIGRHLSEVLSAEALSALSLYLEVADAALRFKSQPVDIVSASGETRTFECFPHRCGRMVILEFLPPERATKSTREHDELRHRLITALVVPSTVEELTVLGARLCRLIAGYDRVMVYKFHDDMHGEVIAESTERSDPFIGLHYPASDIPEPARRHFLLNRTRIIADVDDKAAPIWPPRHPVSGAALDLTHSNLRAVSPMHIEYLKNMGVRASMSNTLIVNGQLWGLIACHHYQPRRLSGEDLGLCELLAGLLGSFIQALENASALRKSVDAENLASDIEREGFEDGDLATVIEHHAPLLTSFVDAQGLIFRSRDRLLTYGDVPDPLPAFEKLKTRDDGGVWTTDRLADVLELSDGQMDRCAGGALLTLSEDGSEYLFFCRQHYLHTVDWAGDPEKGTTQTTTDAQALGPRQSFAKWQQEISGVSRPFTEATYEALRVLRRAFFALRSRERERDALLARVAAEAAQARVRIEFLETARKNTMGELANAIAHELNQPLAALMNYINACRKELSGLGDGVPANVLELMAEAVTEANRAGELVRRLRGFIERGDLEPSSVDINDLTAGAARLAISASSAEDVELRTDFGTEAPRVWADRIQIEQVIFNLIRNGIEAMDGSKSKVIAISTRRDNGNVEVAIADQGRGIPADLVDSLFDPFQSSKPSGMGIGLSLCKSIVQAHGGVIKARNTGDGAEISFTLPLEAWDASNE